jgi:CheY-like chemotaxis protein
MSSEPITIVLAEDDDGHATLVERNLRRAGFLNNFLRARDGQEALDLLTGAGDFADKKPKGPLLLVLDLKMPRLDGIEVLRVLKSLPHLARIPVIMLTTTDDPREVEKCYELGCSVYILKPIDYEAFIEAIRRLGLFLQLVKLPSPA